MIEDAQGSLEDKQETSHQMFNEALLSIEKDEQLQEKQLLGLEAIKVIVLKRNLDIIPFYKLI